MSKNTFSDFNITIPVHWAVKWTTAFGIVFFLWVAFLAQMNKEGVGYVIFFVAFSLLECLGFVFSLSTLQVNQKSIVATILRTKYRINWDEVETIETDGGTFAFLGNNKCFPINLGWAGKEKIMFMKFLEDLIDQRKIEVKPISSLRWWQINTKLESGES